MTRIILAVAAALLAAPTLFTTAAQACISCEYVPEVTKSATKPSSKSYEPKQRYQQERASKAVRERPMAKKRIEPAARKVETAKTDASKTNDNNESTTTTSGTSSLIKTQVDESATTSAPVETQSAVETQSGVETPSAVVDTPPAAVEPQAQPETSTVSTATLSDAEKPAEEPKVEQKTEEPNKKVGCKKFFPAVGMTLSVACE